jgi:hypothetical protein
MWQNIFKIWGAGGILAILFQKNENIVTEFLFLFLKILSHFHEILHPKHNRTLEASTLIILIFSEVLKFSKK